jgi:hypothetical protein
VRTEELVVEEEAKTTSFTSYKIKRTLGGVEY